MADLSWQARRQHIMVVSDDTAYCYDRVNHIIMSFIWLVLTNGNIPAIVASIIRLQTMWFFQQTGFGKSKTYFGGINYLPYMMGLGQGNRAAPPSWIQHSKIMVTVFKQLSINDHKQPNLRHNYPLHGNHVCWRHQHVHIEGIHTRPRGDMGANSDQDHTVELHPECNGRGIKTGKMLLVTAWLHLHWWQVVIRRLSPTKTPNYQSGWLKKSNKTRGGCRIQEDAWNLWLTCRRKCQPPYIHQGQINTVGQQNDKCPSTQPHHVGSIQASTVAKSMIRLWDNDTQIWNQRPSYLMT